MDTCPVAPQSIAQAPMEMYQAIALADNEPSQPSLGQSLRAEVDELSLQLQVNALQQCRTCNTPYTRAYA